MAGKEFPILHRDTDIGSSPKAQITLIKDAGAAPLHARIVDSGDRRTIRATGGELLVNGQSVRDRRLRSGDRVQIGATTLTYAETLAD
jgi:predicted component of type VI protein secretion system